MRHLRTRIIVFLVALLTLVQGAAFLLVSAANSRSTYAIPGVPDTLAPFDPLRSLLMGLAALSFVASMVGSYFIARSITRPLRRLSESAARIRNGDYSD